MKSIIADKFSRNFQRRPNRKAGGAPPARPLRPSTKSAWGFNRSRRHVRRERDRAISTHTGGAIRTFGQCAARKFLRISGARRSFLFASKKPQGFLMP
jgi:hypothetical protein